MGLEHRGNRFSQDEDIIRLLDARTAAEDIPSASDAAQLIESRTSDFASKSYVDSTFSNYATQAEVDAAYANKVPASALGSTLLKLDDDGLVPADLLPTLSTRGARWIDCGTFSIADPGFIEVSDGGFFNTSTILDQYQVSGSLMGNRPYHVLGFAQVEIKGNFCNSNPILYITTNVAGEANNIAIGHGMPGHTDWYHITATPAASSNKSTTNFTGSNWFYLTARSQTATSDFSQFMARWGLLCIPTL